MGNGPLRRIQGRNVSLILKHKFDLCDPENHFAYVVPLRANLCPPLQSAIFTASARHLSWLNSCNSGSVEYHRKILPNLRMETAVQYHNQCITHLVSLSGDPREVLDKNLLAAAVILRFYEEVDGESVNQYLLCTTNHQLPSAIDRRRQRDWPPKNSNLHRCSSSGRC